jgi:hypothetical protein
MWRFKQHRQLIEELWGRSGEKRESSGSAEPFWEEAG